jgi:hypothetical protein
MKTGAGSSLRLWAVGPRQVNVLARKLSADTLEWCYFGMNPSRREKMTAMLASAQAINIAEELNRVACEIKQPFLDWIAAIGSRQADKLNWWASKLATKSPLQTDFFLLVCYHQLFQSWVAEGPRSRTRIVIVEDPWLRSLLQRDFAIAGAACLSSKYEIAAATAYWLARVPLAIGYVIAYYAWMKLLAGLVLPCSLSVGGKPLAGPRAILLYTWIEPSCFRSSGRLADVYTGRLEDVLVKQGETVVRLTPLAIPAKFLWRLRSAVRELVATPRYLGLGDILRAAVSAFRLDDVKTVVPLLGGDFSPLLARELLRERGHPAFAGYQLSYFAQRRVARAHGGRLKCVIYPFENQPWEKMLCLAWKHEAPHVRLIGYQHASIPTLLLSFFLGKDEPASVPLPDFIVTNGKATLDLLRVGGFPEEKLADGGALRFEHLFRMEKKHRTGGAAKQDEYRVLVGFPTFQPPAACLLRDLLELFPTPYLDAHHQPRVTFVLKCHPDLPWKRLGRAGTPLPAWFAVSERRLDELIEEADLFLYVPPTGSWQEAYWAGVPVLKYRGEYLDVDSTAVLGGEELPVCTRDTLRASLTRILLASRSSMTGDPQASLHHRFSVVDESVWAKLVRSAP